MSASSTRADVVGAEGFEPSNTGSKVPRLTAWPRPSIGRDLSARRPRGRPTDRATAHTGAPRVLANAEVYHRPMRRPASRRPIVRVSEHQPIGPLQASTARGADGLGKQRRKRPTRCPSSRRPGPLRGGRPSIISSISRVPRGSPGAWRSLTEGDRPGRPSDIDRRRPWPSRDRRVGRSRPRSSSSHRYASAVGDAERRLDHHDAEPPRRRRPDTARRRDRVRAPCRPGGRTARPSRAPRRCAASSCAGPAGLPQPSLRPTSAAAASALPPPRPAATGICFSSRTCTSRGSPAAPDRAPEQPRPRATPDWSGRRARRARASISRNGPGRTLTRDAYRQSAIDCSKRPHVVKTVGPSGPDA